MSNALDLRSMARALNGEVSGSQVLAPGPGHGPKDRSLSVTLSAAFPDGFIVHSFAGDNFGVCRDHVRERLGLSPDDWKRDRQRERTPSPKPKPHGDAQRERDKARWVWRQRQPIAGSIAETYLREARGYGGLIPPTLAYLPPRERHEPALIAAFGIATEPEPGMLAIADAAVTAVQLIKLRADGSGKADVKPNKIIIGKGALGLPIVPAPPNDLLGLAITEGLEDALSVHEATGLGAWASGGAPRLPALAGAVPDYIDFVTGVADRDPAGIKNMRALAELLRKRHFKCAVSFLDGGCLGEG
jgi:hypothetical protein